MLLLFSSIELHVQTSWLFTKPLKKMHSENTKHGSTNLTKSHISRALKDFCESTSLHGYNYLYSTDSITLKTLWIIIILIATGTGITFLVSNTNSYMNSKIVTNIESATVSLDVSICFHLR